jgi:hypothetical protein
VFHAGLRRRWRSWLAIALLISVVGGLVLAAAAAGRRTENAFPRFVAAHGFDSIVYATRPVPVAHLPGVASVTDLVLPDAGNPTCDCAHPINGNDFGVAVVSGRGAAPFTLVSGQLPDPSKPDQVLASSTLQQDDGVHVGSVIHVAFEAPSQAADYNNPDTGTSSRTVRASLCRWSGSKRPRSSSLRGAPPSTSSMPAPGSHGRCCRTRPHSTSTTSACATVRPASPSSTNTSTN